MHDTTTSLVMTGLLADFKLEDVLQVVGLSRQFTAVELRRHDGQVHGTIYVKAGRVIGAQSPRVRGKPAFLEMFGAAAEVFVVSRLPEPSSFPTPLGPLANLLMDALDEARGWEPEETPTPVPVSVPAPSARPRPASPLAAASVAARQPPPLAPRTRPLAEPAPVRTRNTAPTTPAPVVPIRPSAAGSTPPQTHAEPRGIAVAIASPKGGAGKTTITLNLALALAQLGRKTIVIDADVNGDLMSLLAARGQVTCGAYDILDRPDDLDQALRDTAVPGLRILPASGATLPPSATARRSLAAEWGALIARARARAEIVLIDCPAGMFDTTADVLTSCSHVIGVLQSEMIASRSASMFDKGLEALPASHRPKIMGVVVNMFQGRSAASVEAFHHLATAGDAGVMFETTIPRSDAFAAASLAGVPLRFAPGGSPSAVAWVFDSLASELCGRTGLDQTAEPVTERFLR